MYKCNFAGAAVVHLGGVPEHLQAEKSKSQARTGVRSDAGLLTERKPKVCKLHDTRSSREPTEQVLKCAPVHLIQRALCLRGKQVVILLMLRAADAADHRQ